MSYAQWVKEDTLAKDEKIVNLSGEIESVKKKRKNILELKNTLSEIKMSLNELNTRMELIEEPMNMKIDQ